VLDALVLADGAVEDYAGAGVVGCSGTYGQYAPIRGTRVCGCGTSVVLRSLDLKLRLLTDTALHSFRGESNLL
jgi:hypothetical protein